MNTEINTISDLMNFLEEKKYRTIKEWSLDNFMSYRWALDNSDYKSIKSKYFPNSKGYKFHSLESTKEILAKGNFKTIREWVAENQGSYLWAVKQPFYEYLCLEFFPERPKRNNYSKATIQKFLRKMNFKTIREWVSEDQGSYLWAVKQYFYPEIKYRFFPTIKIGILGKKEMDYSRSDIEFILHKKKYKSTGEWLLD